MAGIKALAMLQCLVDLEAALHRYHDTFLLIGCISAAGIVPALWMGNRRPATRQVAKTDGAAPASDVPSPGTVKDPLPRNGSGQRRG